MKPARAMVAEDGRDLEGPISGGNPAPGVSEVVIGFSPKREGSIRLLHWNIRGFTRSSSNFYLEKTTALRDHSLKSEADIILWNELNTQWPLVPPEKRLDTKVQCWWEACHISKAHNRRDPSGKKDLHGGCAALTCNKMCHRVIRKGEDKSHLGRWAWTTYQGKRNRNFTVVTAYRPCVPSPASSNAVWHQHNSYFSTIDRAYEDPRTALLNDLFAELSSFHAKGHLIALSMDLNEIVTAPAITSRFRAIGMRLAHNLPNDFNTHVDGSFPIDGIWLSSSLVVNQVGVGTFDLSTSDHRPLWVDISVASALGDALPPMTAACSRRLKLVDPRIVKKYNEVFDSQLKKRGVHQRIQNFNIEYPLSSPSQVELEKIDWHIMEAMKIADRQCRKFKTGAVPWSPSFQKAKDSLVAWHLIYRRQVEKRKIGLRTVTRQCKRGQVEVNICHLSKEEICHGLAEAKRQYRIAVAKAAPSRTAFYEDLANARAKESGTKAESQLRMLMKREELRKSSRIIRSSLGTMKGARLTHVEVGEEASARLTSDKAEIEEACIRTNIDRVQDSNETPFRTEPLLSLFGAFGETRAGEDVLQGTFNPPPNTPQCAIDTLPYFRQYQEPTAFSPQFDPFEVNNFCEGWRKMKETTGCRSSFPHFGHFKAPKPFNHGAQVLSSFAKIAFQTGHSFKRWQRCTDVMIPKKAKSLRPEKLRLIQLYEPDFNHQNKLIGKIAMFNGEETKALAPEQYGSRKKHRAVDQALNKVLLFDSLRYERRAAVLCSNDAKSCYDRVTHVAAYLALRRFGVPKPVLSAMFLTLQKMRHTIRTAFGDSDTSYGGEEWCRPPNGYGQGNGSAPSGYAALTSPLLDKMRKEGCTFDISCPLSQSVINLAGFAFVDDTDTGTAAREGESFLSLMHRAQDLIIKWGDALSVTGGALEPNKSDVTIVKFAEEERLPRYIFESGSLKMRAPNGELQPLKNIAPSEGRMTLGVMISADGSQTNQLEHMIKKSEEWAESIRVAHLPRHISWLALRTTIFKTLGYPLAATCLSESQCKAALSPALRRGLASSGIVRNLDRRVIHAPNHLQGFGLPSLYDLQGYEHIKRILNDGPSKTITGTLIRLNIELTKLETGLGGNLFDTDYSKVEGWIPISWVTSTWEYLSASNMALIEGTPRMPLLRDGDCYLMERILSLNFFSPSELVSINHCRRFLGLFNLADIATADGKSVRMNCYIHPDHHIRHRLTSWKCASEPPKASEWALWRLAINKAFLSQVDPCSFRLSSRLGKWSLELRHWFWFFSPSHKTVLQRREGGFLIYKTNNNNRNLRNTTNSYYPTSSTVEKLPADSTLATVEMINGSLTISGLATAPCTIPPGLASQNFRNSPADPTPTILRAIQNLHPSKRWFFHHCAMPRDGGAAIANLIGSGTTCIGVADGSHKDPLSAASFSLASPSLSRQLHLVGSVPTPGGPKEQSSYRAELTGILALILSLELICRANNVTTGSVQLSCDNDTALKWVFGLSAVTCETPDNDVIRSARAALSSLPITCIPVVVKGHRDDHIPFQKLPFLNQQNVLMDNLAKLFRNNLLRRGYKPKYRPLPFIDQQQWTLLIDSKPVTSNFYSTVLHHRSSKNRISQLQEKGFSSTASSLTDWESIGSALRSLPLHRQHWLLKHVSGRSSVGEEMLRRKVWQSDYCPRCSAGSENTSHIALCRAPSAKRIWTGFIENLPEWFDSQNTDSTIKEAILIYLRRWHSGLPFPTQPLLNTTPEIKSALSAQHEIGWDNFIFGRCATQWTEIQHSHALHLGLRRTGKQWMRHLIKHLWTFLWDQWEDRNDVLHKNSIAQERQGLATLRQTASQEFNKGPMITMTPEERSLWKVSLPTLLDRSPMLLRSWLEKVEAARSLANSRLNNGPYQQERASLASWLQQP